MSIRAVGRASLLVLCLSPLSCTAMLGGFAEDEGGADEATSFTPGKPIDRAVPFDGPIVASPSESIRFSRLTHSQYERTVTDLLRAEESFGLSELFVAEPLITTFDTDATLLNVSLDTRLDYERAAEMVANLLVTDDDLLRAAVGNAIVDEENAAGFVETFVPRAFRRPITDDEKLKLNQLFSGASSQLEGSNPFLDGVFLVTAYVLQSPHFLYRQELSTEVVDGRVPLSPYEVASKLSYALLGSMPDEGLFAAAGDGTLNSPEGVRSEVARLLRTPRARQMVEDFHYQLLEMREYDAISKNVGTYPQFSEGFADDLVTEALSFVRHVTFDLELGLNELLTAPYTFANSRVASMYGLPTPAGATDESFARLDLPEDQRAGLLTQIGFLATYGEGATPNTILRGVNVAHNVLCIDLPPPPDDVPALTEAVGETNRERVTDLTKDPGCANCHATYINPLGFAFEALDGVGAARSQDNGHPVDSSSSYKIDGQVVTFDGAPELMQSFAGSAQAHDCYAQHWAQFLFGRAIDTNDDNDEALVLQGGWLSQSEASIVELITEIVTTDAFLSRSP